MKKRERKPTDQQQAEKAFNILRAAISEHPEMEPALWTSGCLSLIADAYEQSDLTYEEFKEEMESAVKFYKQYWE